MAMPPLIDMDNALRLLNTEEDPTMTTKRTVDGTGKVETLRDLRKLIDATVDAVELSPGAFARVGWELIDAGREKFYLMAHATPEGETCDVLSIATPWGGVRLIEKA